MTNTELCRELDEYIYAKYGLHILPAQDLGLLPEITDLRPQICVTPDFNVSLSAADSLSKHPRPIPIGAVQAGNCTNRLAELMQDLFSFTENQIGAYQKSMRVTDYSQIVMIVDITDPLHNTNTCVSRQWWDKVLSKEFLYPDSILLDFWCGAVKTGRRFFRCRQCASKQEFLDFVKGEYNAEAEMAVWSPGSINSACRRFLQAEGIEIRKSVLCDLT